MANPGPSQETSPWDGVICQLTAVNRTNVDKLIIIRNLLQSRTGKYVEDIPYFPGGMHARFIWSGEEIFKFVDDHAEGDIVNSAPRIIGDVLDKLGNVLWLVAGLSVIGYVLEKAETMTKNNKCFDRLQKLVDLADDVRKLDYSLEDQEKELKGAIVTIVNKCILWSRFFKATGKAEDLSSIGKQIDSLCPDVFLSHSGVQKNFVRQLYKDLTEERVLCFFDESRESLPLGEEWVPRIFEAVETCRVAVLLLSMDFIRSRWPMVELSAFLKAKKSGKNSNLQILPLFFKISPRDLKDLTSDTQDILEWTKLEISEETRIEWKEALRAVRKLNGLQPKKDEDETSFRDRIIEAIHTLLC